MKTTTTWEAMVDRGLGYTGLLLIGAMAWTCDRLGVTAPSAAARPAMRPVAREARS